MTRCGLRAAQVMNHARDYSASARDQNLTQFEADVLSQNRAMLAVFKRGGFPMQQRRDGGVIHLTLTLAADNRAA